MRRFRRIASLVNASDNMERDLIEQATQLKSTSHGNNDTTSHRISERVESCQTPAIIDWQETISDHILYIARLESLKDSLRGRFVHVDVGYGLRWHAIETAFESRILTGAVINTNHIE